MYQQDAIQVAANFSGYISGNVTELRLGTIDPSARINIAGDLHYMIVMSSDTGADNTVSYTVNDDVNTTDIQYLYSTVDSTGNFAAYYYLVEVPSTIDGVDPTYEGRIDVYDNSGSSTVVTTYSGLADNITGLEYFRQRGGDWGK